MLCLKNSVRPPLSRLQNAPQRLPNSCSPCPLKDPEKSYCRVPPLDWLERLELEGEDDEELEEDEDEEDEDDDELELELDEELDEEELEEDELEELDELGIVN